MSEPNLLQRLENIRARNYALELVFRCGADLFARTETARRQWRREILDAALEELAVEDWISRGVLMRFLQIYEVFDELAYPAPDAEQEEDDEL